MGIIGVTDRLVDALGLLYRIRKSLFNSHFMAKHLTCAYNIGVMSELSLTPVVNLYSTAPEEPASPAQEQNDTDFQDLLKILLLSLSLQSFSPSSASQSSSVMGFSFQSYLMPLMFNLLESLMAQQINEQVSAPREIGLDQAGKVHINQFEAELQVGGDGRNANCGPTSLVIALHSLGMRLPGEGAGMSAGQAVDLARRLMVADAGRDGVDALGERAEGEHSTYTNFDDLMRGAHAAGARAERITPTAESIRAALERGGRVIVSGTFEGKQPLPWTGDRGSDNTSAPGGATRHLIAVTGYNRQSNLFIVNDPARRKPLSVSAEALERFMRGNAGALALYRP